MKRSSGINYWSIKDAVELYGIENWGSDFFQVNKDGEVTVTLRRGESLEPVSLFQIAKGLDERGITMPVLMHFPDLIFNRIDRINKSFNNVIKRIRLYRQLPRRLSNKGKSAAAHCRRNGAVRYRLQLRP